MNRAIFLDRDGTINHDKGFTYKKEDLHFLPNAIEGLKKISEMNFMLFIVTNQSGISVGKFSEEEFHEFTEHFVSKLDDEGVVIEKTYYAPDHPDQATEMRKPDIGMLKQAEKEFNIDLKKSYVIGDRGTDVEMGHKAGCVTILIDNENLKKYPPTVKPDVLVSDMIKAAEFIEAREDAPTAEDPWK